MVGLKLVSSVNKVHCKKPIPKNWSKYSRKKNFAVNMWTDKSPIDPLNVEIRSEAAQFPEKEYINRIFVAVYTRKPQVWEIPRFCPETSTIWYRSWIRLLYKILWRADGPLNEVWESFCSLSVRIFATFFLMPPFILVLSSSLLSTMTHIAEMEEKPVTSSLKTRRKGWGREEWPLLPSPLFPADPRIFRSKTT